MQKHNLKINILLIILAVVVTAVVAYGIVPKRFWNKSTATTNSSQETVSVPVVNEQSNLEPTKQNEQPAQVVQPVQPEQPAQFAEPTQSGRITLADVAKHDNENDCWFVVEGVVYDVTAYVEINKHPGGVETVLEGCGKDATELYNTKSGEGKPHSNRATADLQNYKIGVLTK